MASPVTTYPKSCLKRSSIASTSSTDSDASQLASCLSSNLYISTSSTNAGTSASFCPSASVSRERRKSVSFSDDDDVRLIYPVRQPLRKQACKAAKRVFKACANALRIDESYDTMYNVDSAFYEDEIFHTADDELNAILDGP